MSLTSILREKRRSNIKNWFKFHFPNPGLKDKIEIIVPPSRSESAYSGEIGTAFDYLMRFNLKRINKDKFIEKKYWVADEGLKLILSEFKLSEKEWISVGYFQESEVHRVNCMDFLINEFQKAKDNYENFIQNGMLTKDLIKSTIFLAKLDLKYRTGITDANFDNIESEQIDELEKLFKIVPWNKFSAENYLLPNPTFGKGSTLVRGADADFIIDNTLIDIKSSKNLKINRSDLNQIIGYYLLSILGGISGKSTAKIEKVGIYFARYGYIWEYTLADFYQYLDYIKFANEFKQLVLNVSLDLTHTLTKSADKRSSNNTIPLEYVIDENDFKCPYCNSKDFIRNGKTLAGKFKYRCKSCKKYYSSEIEAYNSIQSKNDLKIVATEYIIDKDDFKCPHCESKDFIKSGKTSSGKYRYKCKECNKTFSTEIDTSISAEMIKDFFNF